MRRLLLAATLLLPFAAPAFAQPAKLPESGGGAMLKGDAIKVEKPFTRVAQLGGVGGVFFTLVNTGPADRLVSASSKVAGKVEMHETVSENNVSKMRPIAALEVPAGGNLAFAPGGRHVMLVGLKQALAEGDSVPVTLVFEKSPPITFNVRVMKAGALSSMMEHMPNMPGHKAR